MTICREWTLVKTQGAAATAEPLKCRSWSCAYCRPDRHRRLIAEAIGGNPNTFITLTVKPKLGQSPVERARALVAAWRQVRKWNARLDGNGTIPFLAVFERTKRGEPHLHILCRSKWIPQHELSDEMAYLIDAPVVWIERIDDPAKTAAYCAKYCGKDPFKFDTLKRYWQSRDYDQREFEDPHEDEEIPPTFEIVKCSIREWADSRGSAGWMVQETPTGAVAWNIYALAARERERTAKTALRGPPWPGERASPASNPAGL